MDMRKAYTRPAERSFAVMGRREDDLWRVLPLSPHRGRPAARSDRRRVRPPTAAPPAPLRCAARGSPAATDPAPRRGLVVLVVRQRADDVLVLGSGHLAVAALDGLPDRLVELDLRDVVLTR